jgi:hypothetical protein
MQRMKLPSCAGTAANTRTHRNAFKSFCSGKRGLVEQGRRGITLQCSLVPCKLAGVGSSTPKTVLTNSDLAKYVDTNDEWIVSRTGIQQRHVLGEGETLSQHAAAASRKALEMAGVSAGEVDLILMATSSPDDAFGNACAVSPPAALRQGRRHADQQLSTKVAAAHRASPQCPCSSTRHRHRHRIAAGASVDRRVQRSSVRRHSSMQRLRPGASHSIAVHPDRHLQARPGRWGRRVVAPGRLARQM